MSNTMEQLASIVFEIVTDNATEAQMQQLAEVLGTVQNKYARSFKERIETNVLFAALVEAADYRGAIEFDCSAHNPTLHRHNRD